MIGILAIQGGVAEHEAILDGLGILHKRVVSLKDVDGLTGFIIPGGESTVMDMFMRAEGLDEWLKERVADVVLGDDGSDGKFVRAHEFKVFGTCAGLIILAKHGLLNVTVERNAYGRQVNSFVGEVGVFIRAPKILNVGEGVEVLAEHGGMPVFVRQGNIFGATFHPELVGDSSLHAGIFS